MAIFIRPIPDYWNPSKGEIVAWLYQIWDYLGANPVPSEDEFNALVEKYLEEHPIIAPVTSVNEKTGEVVIKLDELGGVTAEQVQSEIGRYLTEHPIEGAVTSVNDKTGDVEITLKELGGVTAAQVGQMIADLYGPTNPPPYPVSSVNGKTGAVTVGELITPSVVCLISEDPNAPGILLTNSSDAGAVLRFNNIIQAGNIPRLEIADKTGTLVAIVYTSFSPPPYPVRSVNGQTGDVQIQAGGVNPTTANVTKGQPVSVSGLCVAKLTVTGVPSASGYNSIVSRVITYSKTGNVAIIGLYYATSNPYAPSVMRSYEITPSDLTIAAMSDVSNAEINGDYSIIIAGTGTVTFNWGF